MSTATNATITVRFLNGEMISLSHRLSRGLEMFKRLIYDAYPDIPYDCLHLTRIPQPSEDDVDEIIQLMNLVSLYKDPNAEVDELYDGDLLFAMVDTSKITVHISYEIVQLRVPSPVNPDIYLVVNTYTVVFTNPETGIICELDIFHHVDTNTFADSDAFIHPTPSDYAYYHSSHKIPKCHATPNVQWFSSITECLLSIQKRFPKDSDKMDALENYIKNREWCSEVKDDQSYEEYLGYRDEPDYEYMGEEMEYTY